MLVDGNTADVAGLQVELVAVDPANRRQDLHTFSGNLGTYPVAAQHRDVELHATPPEQNRPKVYTQTYGVANRSRRKNGGLSVTNSKSRLSTHYGKHRFIKCSPAMLAWFLEPRNLVE